MRFSIQIEGDGIFRQCADGPVNAPLVLARMVAGREQVIVEDDESRKARVALGKELAREGVYSFVTNMAPPRGVLIHKFGHKLEAASRPGIEILGHSVDDEETPVSLFLAPGVGALLVLGFCTGYMIWSDGGKGLLVENRAVLRLMEQLWGKSPVEVFRCIVEVGVDNMASVGMLTMWEYTDQGARIRFQQVSNPIGGIVIPGREIPEIVGILGLLYSVDSSYFRPV